MKNLIRVGRVSSANPVKCTARVAFEDQANVVSYDLPVLVHGSLHNKEYWMPAPDEQVVCLFLPSGNAQGFIVGAFYSDVDKPPAADQNKRLYRFADGTTVEYDTNTHTLTIDAKGLINIKSTSGLTIQGDITVAGDVVADGISLKNHVHNDDVVPGDPETSPPIGGA